MTSEGIRCRKIVSSDIERLVVLLTRRFPRRSSAYWQNAFDRLSSRPPVGDYPQFGYLLECGMEAVGALLLICSSPGPNGNATIRCNLSSWCVEPKYEAYAWLLVTAALKVKNATFINVSPAMHTLQTIKAQGFSCYSRGQYLAVPLLSGGSSAEASAFDPRADDAPGFLPAERDLLADHVTNGCIVLTCKDKDAIYPFVFLRRRSKLGPVRLSYVQLCYCRDPKQFQQFSKPLGRALAKMGIFATLLDSNGPVPGLVGRYIPDRAPKYYRGPQAPRLCDLTYTEAVLFGA